MRKLHGGLHDYVGMLVALIPLFFLVIPAFTEILMMWMQAQEVEAVSKAAAEKVCSMLASNRLQPSASAAAGTTDPMTQGALGALLDRADVTNSMTLVMNKTIYLLAKSPNSYYVTPLSGAAVTVQAGPGRDAANPSLELLDPFGTDLSTTSTNGGGSPPTNPYGPRFMGASPGVSICPANPLGVGSGSYDPGWCLRATKQQIQETMRKLMTESKGTLSSIDDPNESDASYRAQLMQMGRCRAGDDMNVCNENARAAMRGQLTKCKVCLTKIRQSIFTNDGFGTGMLQRSLPKTLYKCGESPFKATTSTSQYVNAFANRRDQVYRNTTGPTRIFRHYAAYHQTGQVEDVGGLSGSGARYGYKKVRDQVGITKQSELHSEIDANFFNDDVLLDNVKK